MSDLITQDQRGVAVRQEFSATEIQQSPETQTAAVAAREKAIVEAQFIMAERHPRNWDDVRMAMLHHCKSTRFAAIARYSRPAGKELINGEWVEKRAEGFTTRFTEVLAQEMGNIKLGASVTYEDDLVRIVRFSVLDLQKNVVKEREVAIAKAVERRGVKNKKGEWEPPRGRDVISQRLNTLGEPTYLVRATAEELRAKTNAEESKSQRDFITRMCPRYILEDCEEVIQDTLKAEQARDPDAFLRKILDSFGSLQIRPSDLETYIGRPARQWLPRDVEDLRGLFSAIRDGQTTFQDAMRMKFAPTEDEDTAEHSARLQRQIEEQREKYIADAILRQSQKGGVVVQDKREEVAEQKIQRLRDELLRARDEQTEAMPIKNVEVWRKDLDRSLNRIEAQMGSEAFRPLLMKKLGTYGYESVSQIPNDATATEFLKELAGELTPTHAHEDEPTDTQLFVEAPDVAGPTPYELETATKRRGFGGRK